MAEWADGKELASLAHDAQVDGVIRAILGGETMVGLALGAPEFQRR